jgi:DNA (cytosine-5)-methyltransferase 1
MGYNRAGFDVVGVDHKLMPRYPFEFHQADAFEFLEKHGRDFDAIHASPPCQAYSVATIKLRADGHQYPDLLANTRIQISLYGSPWVIENVPSAPMRPDFKLCGCMFGLPMLRRERWFETNWNGFALRQSCNHSGPTLSVTGRGVGAGNGQRGRIKAVLGRNPGIADAKAAMGINWMSRDELSQAIPPAYTKWIGQRLMEYLEGAKGVRP